MRYREPAEIRLDSVVGRFKVRGFGMRGKAQRRGMAVLFHCKSHVLVLLQKVFPLGMYEDSEIYVGGQNGSRINGSRVTKSCQNVKGTELAKPG